MRGEKEGKYIARGDTSEGSENPALIGQNP